jgi:type III pantothenate kinase
MQRQNQSKLIAVDVGNNRSKWGLFVHGQLVEVSSFKISVPWSGFDNQLQSWEILDGAVEWAIASVNASGSNPIREWIASRGFVEPIIVHDPATLPLRVELQRPEAVGIDRLLDAIAANVRRPAGRAAIVVDAGSAITVDAISAQGSFLGGAIAIGVSLAGRALHEYTSLLPLVQISSAPTPLGKSTVDALQSGLFWGSVGAVKELVARVGSAFGSDPVVFITGGDGETLAPHLGDAVQLVPHLTLHGLYLAYDHVRRL